MVASGPRQAVVTREQNGVQHLGQCYVNRVISGDIVPQGPNPRQQKIVRVSSHTDIGQIAKCNTPAFAINLASYCISADDLCYFDVEQVRRV